jgi:hypothetical protein
MKKVAFAFIVAVLGYLNAQAQQAPVKQASAHDGKDGQHTYVVTANGGKQAPGGKHIANRSKTGKTNKALLNKGAVKPAASDKNMNAKPRPTAFNDRGKRHGHHKQHRNNGKHMGEYKHTIPPVPSRGCNK